jgi:hypothetical protein
VLAQVVDESGLLLYINDVVVPVLTDEDASTEASFPLVAAVEALPAEESPMAADSSPEA